ncbi:MAG: N-acetylglucosamine-6-phosphate deacetylase [Eubacteriales bacterium]|nr:N-acetylglucosamine-6-phosphate deacetylase [Eubacteriales bacterium]
MISKQDINNKAADGMKAIENGIILTPEGPLKGHSLVFDQKVRGIVPGLAPKGNQSINAKGLYVSPGLIDLHIHGYLGEDASDGSARGIRRMAEGLIKNGVTAFLPTTMTLPWGEIERAFDVARGLKEESKNPEFSGSEIMGVHAEGPFINPRRKGAQSDQYILPPDAQKLLRHKDIVKIVTMAPEVPGGLDFIRSVTGQSGIVVSIGHTEATYEETMAAIEAGASHITHTFNAMTGLHHRNPGVVGAALTTDVVCELIADTFHVHPGLYRLLKLAKGEKLVLVTDCTRAGGLGDGEYTLGGQAIHVTGVESRLADGTIAGSVLKLNQAVLNFSTHAGLPLHEAIAYASQNAARVIGEEAKGSLEVGKDADIALFDGTMRAHACFVRGQQKYGG